MNDEIEIFDKWVVIVGMKDKSGDPSLHLHRIYDYKDKEYALENIKHLNSLYPVVFVQQIKCDKNLS